MTTRVLALVLCVLAFAVLAAHFWRAGAWLGVAACAGGLALVAWPRTWAARLVQIGLAAGALEWAWTAWLLVQQRQALGQPWLRLAAILAAVALATLAAALLHRFLETRPSATSGA